MSCLADIDPADALPPLTAYFAMRVGRLPYFAPGDNALEELEETAKLFLLLRGLAVRPLDAAQRAALPPPT